MNYCSDCDIAFEERQCPLCDAKKEISQLNEKIEALEERE